jgi:predicted protein tyrosine phosphatase
MWNFGYKKDREEQLERVVRAFVRSIERGDSILIHCQKGVHRAAAALASLSMVTLGISFVKS